MSRARSGRGRAALLVATLGLLAAGIYFLIARRTVVSSAAPEALTLSRTLAQPIVVVGLDGADWQIAEPLMEQGKLPNLARLRRTGKWGSMRSAPPLLSPLLWT